MSSQLNLIAHDAQGSRIHQRAMDGYINATAMCQAFGKRWNHYAVNEGTKAFILELSSEAGIPASELIQSLSGGDPRLQGTWVHPQIAIHLAQWCSPAFAVKVTKWVYDWMYGQVARPATKVPYHLQRYVANQNNIPPGHFSILSEMTQALIAPMEIEGYTLPESMVPDISHGQIFCRWLRDHAGIDTSSLPKYMHAYEDGRVYPANAYPEELLPAWRRHFREEWLPKRAISYFAERDEKAIPYLQRLIAGPTAKTPLPGKN